MNKCKNPQAHWIKEKRNCLIKDDLITYYIKYYVGCSEKEQKQCAIINPYKCPLMKQEK
jgi:hypothetical protein